MLCFRHFVNVPPAKTVVAHLMLKLYHLVSKSVFSTISCNFKAKMAFHDNPWRPSWKIVEVAKKKLTRVCFYQPQCKSIFAKTGMKHIVIVRRAGLLWSQQDFEWRWSVPLFKCLTLLEFSFILFDLCLLITFFNFIMNYVPFVTFWIFTYHKIWILSIMFCSIWSYWIIYFLACLEVSWRVVS